MAQRGFVLPTTVLLVLMVVLTATAITYRVVSRSQMNIAQREQVRVASIAAPAVDRAKSKLEFLFTQDTRMTNGLPSSEMLEDMLLEVPRNGTGVTELVTDKDPFTLPGEQRVDLNGDGDLDNAWVFTDSNTGEQIAYSILVANQGRDTSAKTGGKDYTNITVQSAVNDDKAMALVTRTGPVAATPPSPICPNGQPESGWEVVDKGSTSTLQKNFQINVFVPNTNSANRTLEAFEFQQSRVAERGNKWGAWFRYNLEIYPNDPSPNEATFMFNGAMHTDSNLIVGGVNNFEAFKISSHNSCVYGKEASEITVGVGTHTNVYQGQIVRGSLVSNSYNTAGNNLFHIWQGDDTEPDDTKQLTSSNDSVNNGTPNDVAVNPITLFTTDRLANNSSTAWSRDAAAWDANPINTGGANGAPRVFNRSIHKPFLEDFFRADDRWGPKPRYSETVPTLDIANVSGKVVGSDIKSASDNLPELTSTTQGMDGYWERQAVANGLRLIVGERLELGNPQQWNYDPSRPFDPSKPANTTDNLAANNPENISATSPRDRLYPPTGTQPQVPATGTATIGANEYRQKRSLRDNLAAVQGMVVYHYKAASTGGDFPAACVAFTTHPGTRQTIVDSRTYDRWFSTGVPGNATQVLPKTDFIHGRGTNGWEFKYHPDFDTESKFAAQVTASNPLGIALRNLAYFAGDPKGGAPSFPAVQDGRVHPFPHQAMWGDFSALRRLVEAGHLNTSTAFNALSPADKATVHSAACTLSLLAYNLERETSDYLDLFNRDFSALTNVTERFNTLVGGITRYMRTGVMANQFKVGGKGLDTLLVERGLGRAKWWTDNDDKIQDFLANNTPIATSLGLNPASLDDTALDPYFAAATGVYPGGASDYFNSYGFEDWLAIAPYVSGGVPDSDLALLRNFADQVNQFNSVIRDRDLGFKPGLTKKDVYFNDANREITWNPSNGLTQRVDVKTGVRNANANPAFGIVDEFRDLDGNPATPNVLVQTVVRTRKNGADIPADSEVVEGGVRYFLFKIGSKDYKLWVETVTANVPDPTDPSKTIQIIVQYNVRDANDGNKIVSEIGSGLSYKTNCDPNIFRSLGPGGGGGDNNVAIGGLIGCSARRQMPIRTPSLFYLFPLQDHNLMASDLTAEFQQPAAEEYLVNMTSYDSAYSDDTSLSTSGRFKVVKKSDDPSATPQDIIDSSIFGVKYLSAVPKKVDGTDWVLPVGASGTTRLAINTDGTDNIDANPFLINLPTTSTTTTVAVFPPGTTAFPVSILDKGMFDGREQLAVRVADIDLGRLAAANALGTTEKWIPATACDNDPATTAKPDCNTYSEGMVYAFREDAVREDEIVRPKNSSATTANCLTVADLTSTSATTCRMATTPGSEQDPPLTAKGISLKPVDYVADPDRRPHGFRLRNGSDMSSANTRDAGMTFVTDNSVYILGNLNLHFGKVKYANTSGGFTEAATETRMEEFAYTINDKIWDKTKFYTNRKELGSDGFNVNFARPATATAPATDRWRPVEILADSFTILSPGFVDGAAEDTFTRARPSSVAATTTSYMNQSRPNTAQTVRREVLVYDATTKTNVDDTKAPVWINRNGNAIVGTSAVNTVSGWTALSSSDSDRRLNVRSVNTPDADFQQVNAVFIGGVVPSRPGQGYGGLQNFPRLIEHWQGKTLAINGSFVQLNFSTAATGPFEHDAWEPGTGTDNTNERLGYFFAPIRRWGYDPGLLYYRPAAASRRFASIGTTRSEYFRDLPADDPYVRLLRCAKQGNNFVFTDANVRGTCPP